MLMPSNGSEAMNRADSARSPGSRPPWTIAEQRLVRARVGGERPLGPAMGPVASRRATTARGELGNTGWSKATAMSGPSASWTAIECSGVNRWIDPSRWLLNVTPSSSMTRRSPRRTTWNPPESVRIGRSQPMNAWSPPRSPDPLVARPQVQVVGVGEDDRRAGGRDLVGVERLDRRVGADGHELRRLDDAVRAASAGGRAGRASSGAHVRRAAGHEDDSTRRLSRAG